MPDTPGYIVYTDGSCWTGDRIGAYAWVIVNEQNKERQGGDWEVDTTISRMELSGPIVALDMILMMCGPSVILLYSDSQYVTMGATDRSRQRKKNVDLWNKLDWLVDQHELVAFEHVKGHDGDHYNEMCDELAGQLRKEGQHEVFQST